MFDSFWSWSLLQDYLWPVADPLLVKTLNLSQIFALVTVVLKKKYS
jgi:hypothetical protein